MSVVINTAQVKTLREWTLVQKCLSVVMKRLCLYYVVLHTLVFNELYAVTEHETGTLCVSGVV